VENVQHKRRFSSSDVSSARESAPSSHDSHAHHHHRHGRSSPSSSPSTVRRLLKLEPGAKRPQSPPFTRRSDSSPENHLFRRSTTSTTSGGRHFSENSFSVANGGGADIGRRVCPPPPNVTVLQGSPTFSQHAAAVSTSSILSYLYQSGLHSQHSMPMQTPPISSHHLQVSDSSPYHLGQQHHLPLPPLSASSMPRLPNFPIPPGLGVAAGDFPFPFSHSAADPAAGLVQAAAAAAAAAGLHHLNPAALMLSAAGQLAAVHPWLYPSYLAAAAFGQTAAAAAALHQPQPSIPNPPSVCRPESRRGHHHHNHHHVTAGNSPTTSSTSSSSSSRYAPYPTFGISSRRRADSPSSGTPLIPMTKSSSGPSATASPPAVPDTTDSPGVGGCSATNGRQSPEQPESPFSNLPRPSSTSLSTGYSSRSSRSCVGSGTGALVGGGNSEELKNMEHMVNGLERGSKTAIDDVDDVVDDFEEQHNMDKATTVMDVDSSRC